MKRSTFPPGRYQELDLFIKVLRLLCPNLTDASLRLGFLRTQEPDFGASLFPALAHFSLHFPYLRLSLIICPSFSCLVEKQDGQIKDNLEDENEGKNDVPAGLWMVSPRGLVSFPGNLTFSLLSNGSEERKRRRR